MPFDDSTRSRLQRFVGDARALLTEEFTRQLQNVYGLDPESGEISDLSRLANLDDARRETARILRDTFAHYSAGVAANQAKEILNRIVREQAFTVLNRLCAIRMAEARGIVVETVGKGFQSRGFQVYQRLAGTGLGETGDAYRCYLFSMFDEFAVDLAVLFDRFSPTGRLFPRETALLKLLDLINHADLEPLWAEDETIGWIYQYFNTKEERKKMRDESAAPRNSRELAVRNQFFTPRYVVEFLTDNTLGRTWYEMRQGNTRLAESCRYLVRRPDEVFLAQMTCEENEHIAEGTVAIAKLLQEGTEENFPEFTAEDDASIQRMIDLAHCVDAYQRYGGSSEGWRWFEEHRQMLFSPSRLARMRTQEILDVLFFECRNDRVSGLGKVYRERWFVDAANEVRRRALYARKSDLPQEELLKQPVFVPYRAKKDPRDLKILDPACGSGHFLLYCFDLLLTIYEEAWNDENAPEPKTAELRPLREAYPTLDALRLDVPRLILEHNLHGIDIDPRAVQIAGLCLWLRAQREWHRQGVRATQRPPVRRSNIVCAEPMPGEQKMLDEFVAQLEPKLLGQLIQVVFDKMKLAGEAGSLLKIEEDIGEAVEKARDEYVNAPGPVQGSLFDDQPRLRQRRFDFSGITSEQFFDQAEEKVLVGLRRYAETAENGNSFQRRLFAEDAARGFALIDNCRKRFDVVLMNPPFGDCSKPAKPILEQQYPRTKNDIYAAFVEMALCRMPASGIVGAITSRTGFFLSSFQKWREQILLNEARTTVFADLGYGVLDGAMVETAAYCVLNLEGNAERKGTTTFFRLLQASDKEVALRDSVHNCRLAESTTEIFHVDPASFAQVPKSPFAYWVSNKCRRLFVELPALENNGRQVRVGDHPGNGFRYLRLFWEIPPRSGLDWRCYQKGGDYSPYFNDVHLVANWDPMRKTYRGFLGRRGRANERPSNYEYFFKAGLTWPRRSQRGLSIRALPAGCVFADKGPSIFVPECERLFFLGVTNSAPFRGLVSLQMAFGSYEVGVLQKTPLPKIDEPDAQAEVTLLTTKLLSLRRQFDFSNEVTHAFIVPPLLFDSGHSLAKRHSQSLRRIIKVQAEMNDCQTQLDNLAFRLYGLAVEDQLALSQILFTPVCESESESSDQSDEDEEAGSTPADMSVQLPASELLSYSLGCAVGRWDIRYATGEKQPPPLPDPFDRLPVCPPGMLQDKDGLPATKAPRGYPIDIPWDGILVDDPGHERDIEARVQKVLHVIWKDRADAFEREACEILGVPSLRSYFQKPAAFFADHLKRYSKSRRQAPIYWPLSTPSGSYTVWIYYHRLTDQTLYTCANDYVEKRLKKAAEEANRLRRQTDRTREQEKALEEASELDLELKQFHAELLRIAKFWKPNLNDGVQITAAPLWQFFRLMPWQRKLKQTWEELQAGEYDWAHLAFSIWPDRVKEKCKTDKSLAIAHGLEEQYVEPPTSAKKKSRRKKVEVEEPPDED